MTAAKLLVSSRVRIDLPAGPARSSSSPTGPRTRRVAADLLAQAEHGLDSEAILFTDDDTVAGAVAALVDGHANVRVERVESIDAAVERAEEYAPEHLELHVADPESLVARIRNAGSVFVGCSSVVGDSRRGCDARAPPTGGLARSTGGLGVETFLKPVQVVTATAEVRGARPR